jgi:predicted DNA-binding transcriptional regulator AlpA
VSDQLPTPKRRSGKVIFYSELKPRKGIPYSRTWINELMRQKRFPQNFDLSPNRRPWLEDEIDDYVAERAAERDAV